MDLNNDSIAKSYDAYTDCMALCVSRNIMDIINGPLLVGGQCQMQAKFQVLIRDALDKVKYMKPPQGE